VARWFRSQDQRLLRTHEAPFLNPEWAVGQLLQIEGTVYRVTRWVELPPVSLERGGSVGEWEIWGRKVSDEDLRKDLFGAADRILKDDQ
jgi:hypothetical protein